MEAPLGVFGARSPGQERWPFVHRRPRAGASLTIARRLIAVVCWVRRRHVLAFQREVFQGLDRVLVIGWMVRA